MRIRIRKLPTEMGIHSHPVYLNNLPWHCSISSEATLTTLLLAYNRLDQLTGLENLTSLETLDIQVPYLTPRFFGY
jgi:hypothetical protein